MKSLLLSLFLFFPILVNAQKLTQQEAIAYAEKLYEIEILSEKGKNSLIKQIEKNELMRSSRPNLTDASIDVMTDSSVPGILGFCLEAFMNEFYYRSGMLEKQSILKELDRKGNDKSISEEQQQKLYKKYESRLKSFEGYQIEGRIAVEDTFSVEGGWVIYPPFSVGKDYGLIHHKRSAFGKTCTRTANDLLRIGLINERIHQELLEKIKSQQLFNETQVIGYAAQRVTHYEDYESNHAKEIAFLQKLVETDVLSQENYQHLIASYQPYELKEKFDFLPYCKQALVFDLSAYSLEPEVYYANIFAEIRKIIPDFNYENLEIKITNVPMEYDTESIEQKARISFEADGRKYVNTFFHNYIRKFPQPDDVIDSLPKISTDFHKGINKLLADRNSPQRLYYANKFENGNAYGNKMFGLMMLTQEQFEAWGADVLNYFLFQQSHDNTFNTDNINRFMSAYEQLGLFTNLSAEEIIQAKEKVAACEINSYQSILMCFPKTIVYFDWESGNLENPYEELTLAFAEASRGAFTPEKIVDEFEKSWKKKKTRYSFVFKDKTFETDLKMDSDWLDPEFMKLIEQALVENKVDGKIYYCEDDGQAGGYIFLTNAQYEYLKSHQPDLFPE